MKEYINVIKYLDTAVVDSTNTINNVEIDNPDDYKFSSEDFIDTGLYPSIPDDANISYYGRTERNAISGGYSYYGKSTSARIAAQITKRSNYIFFIDENGYRRARRSVEDYKKLKEGISQKVIEADDIEWGPFIIGNSENAVIKEGDYAGNYIPSRYNIAIRDTDDLIRVISDLHQRVLSEDPQFSAKTTWNDLVTSMHKQLLSEGKVYQITDYYAAVTNEYTSVSKRDEQDHRFDICVLALTKSKISEIAWAVPHDGDKYFENNNLSKWQLWYDIEPEENQYDWCTYNDNHGVIYRMIDEYGNDLPYDFKNIQFKADGINAKYTFSYNENEDDSKLGNSSGNKIQGHIIDGTSYIPYISFGQNCNNNVFNDCTKIKLGNDSNNNLFENGCTSIDLSNVVNNTIFESGCNNIGLGTTYFGDMKNCRFESGVSHFNSVDNFYANNMVVESGVSYINLDWDCTTDATHPSNNVKICSGIHGSGDETDKDKGYKTVTIYDCGNEDPVIYEAGNNKTYVV